MSESLPLDIILKYKGQSKIFFETGTCFGDTVFTAIDAGFDRIYSVEADKRTFENAVEKFNSYSNVTILNGNSPTVMSLILPTIESDVMFFLDAHYDSSASPILEELNSIRLFYRGKSVIIADDVRLMGLGVWQSTPISSIAYSLSKINSRINISFEDNEHISNDLIIAYE